VVPSDARVGRGRGGTKSDALLWRRTTASAGSWGSVSSAALASRLAQLVGRPPVSDLFGVKGRRWLAGLRLALEERETVDGCLRQIEFLDQEIAAIERLIAQDALGSPQIRRLMTVPGVNVIVAASFLAAIGDIGRFESPRKLVGHLGLDPRVR
jgi:transposase